jgi:hypothetical protein
MSLRNRLARLEQQERRPARMVAVENLGDPLPPGIAERPGEVLIVVATGIRRRPEVMPEAAR